MAHKRGRFSVTQNLIMSTQRMLYIDQSINRDEAARLRPRLNLAFNIATFTTDEHRAKNIYQQALSISPLFLVAFALCVSPRICREINSRGLMPNASLWHRLRRFTLDETGDNSLAADLKTWAKDDGYASCPSFTAFYASLTCEVVANEEQPKLGVVTKEGNPTPCDPNGPIQSMPCSMREEDDSGPYKPDASDQRTPRTVSTEDNPTPCNLDPGKQNPSFAGHKLHNNPNSKAKETSEKQATISNWLDFVWNSIPIEIVDNFEVWVQMAKILYDGFHDSQLFKVELQKYKSDPENHPGITEALNIKVSTSDTGPDGWFFCPLSRVMSLKLKTLLRAKRRTDSYATASNLTFFPPIISTS
ncbi:hypothetical protein G7Y89_g931 [Cudoniella acicularis]|uniref:Uncharacterized protein n=1 Tax=Cudoniella acicularis TaxID=354080 RepID=A0A8H4RXV8_9HELO|nr:hypothetical protein G7Y89_g931 [Cudoniella acicularis]